MLRITGYLPAVLNPPVFRLRWQHTINAGAALNPVTAAEGKVFVSEIAISATRVFTCWTRPVALSFGASITAAFSRSIPQLRRWHRLYPDGRPRLGHLLASLPRLLLARWCSAAPTPRNGSATTLRLFTNGKVYVNGGSLWRDVWIRRLFWKHVVVSWA